MPRSRSASESPDRGNRRRSYSPRRRSPPDGRDSTRRTYTGDGERPRRKDAGFRWKERRRDEDREDDDRRRLDRGYRQRYRSRSPAKDKGRDQPRVTERDRDKDREKHRERERERDKDKPKKTATPSAPSGEPMIIVNVNDRLGTKAAIPCLASDPVGLFKAQVAARIGRQPHEILLKRQGERPFKDALTLEDYGVSNGVQLDLELDTGD